jgi:hypothetical protein
MSFFIFIQKTKKKKNYKFKKKMVDLSFKVHTTYALIGNA